MNVRLIGPEGADVGAALVELSGPAKDKLLLAVIRRHTLAIRRKAADTFAEHGIGRAIYGTAYGPHLPGGATAAKGRKADAMRSISGRVRLVNHVFSAEIVVKGLASAMETGGQRTKAHVIFPRARMALHFTVGGAEVFVGIPPRQQGEKTRKYLKRVRAAEAGVHHPGGPVPKHPHTAPAIAADAPALARDIDSVMDGIVERATSKRVS